MGSQPSSLTNLHQTPAATRPQTPVPTRPSPAPSGDTSHSPIYNSNQTVNSLHGSGSVTNNNHIINNIFGGDAFPAHTSDIRTSVTLPPKPIAFYGRDEFLSDAVQLLTRPGTARLAILGSGGMGKTTVAAAILNDQHIIAHFGENRRYFLSCEALSDADAVVIALAQQLRVQASKDLLTAVVAHLGNSPPTILVLDNLETVWLAGGAPVAAVEDLLGTLAQISSLSLIITCRGGDMPQSVEWSNSETTELKPFSSQAALSTFEAKSGALLTKADKDVVKQLLEAVDRMPLAVSLLGQLMRRGNTPSELLARWARERSGLLRTYGTGRLNSVKVSVELSIREMCKADASQEALRLLSLCSMLPDGLRPNTFESLRPHFKSIDQARDNVIAYALANISADRVLKTLSPIRHVVLECHPAAPNIQQEMHSIYFSIADRLPTDLDKNFQSLSAAAAPEMGNLSSLLLALVSQPSDEVVEAVARLTRFATVQEQSPAVALALLPHVEAHPKWKARCLQEIGGARMLFGADVLNALQSLLTAAKLHTQLGNQASAAWCMRGSGNLHLHLGEYDAAEEALTAAVQTFQNLGDDREVVFCRISLCLLMMAKREFSAAHDHMIMAREMVSTLNDPVIEARCAEMIAILYLVQGKDLLSAAAELERVRPVYIASGYQQYAARSGRYLGDVRRRQGQFTSADQLLHDAVRIYIEIGDMFSLAECTMMIGMLRVSQARGKEAIPYLKLAVHLYETLQRSNMGNPYRNLITQLEIGVTL